MSKIITKIGRFYNKEQFCPSLFGLFLNPFYFARKGLFTNISKLANKIQGKTLDIGCGQKPYKNLFLYSTQYLGLELDTPENRSKKKADCFYDGKKMPFDNDTFDSIVCNEVLEHVFNPNEFLEEIYRVLRGGGGAYANNAAICMG